MLAKSAFACNPTRPCRETSLKVGKTPSSISRNVFTQASISTNDLRVKSDPPICNTIQDVSRRQHLALLASAAILAFTPSRSSADPAVAASPAALAVEAIRSDFVERQYYVTGNLSRELFAPDCLFKDPTVEVVGVEPYVRALQTLFDPSTSRADLISIRATDSNTVVLRWRLEGSLKLGGLKIKPYTGTTVYTISNDDKVVRHEETWDISTVDAFVSTFLPGFGAPPAPPVTPAAE